MTNLGSWVSTESQPCPSWAVLSRCTVWTREDESVAYLKTPVVPAHQMASEEGSVGVTELELVPGETQSVTVFDARLQAVPAGVATMAKRAGVVMAYENRADDPYLSNLICEQVPVLMWGPEGDVTRLYESHELDASGSRVVRLRLFIRPRVGLGRGLRFRELYVIIVGAEAALQAQVFSPAHCSTHPRSGGYAIWHSPPPLSALALPLPRARDGMLLHSPPSPSLTGSAPLLRSFRTT